jgi:hypothetical protein
MTRLVTGMVLCLITGCLNLSAQTRTSSTEVWEVEFHVGGAFISTPTEGDGSVPGGTRLTNVGLQMWQVPSWYFVTAPLSSGSSLYHEPRRSIPCFWQALHGGTGVQRTGRAPREE